jgi:hypothetical protein
MPIKTRSNGLVLHPTSLFAPSIHISNHLVTSVNKMSTKTRSSTKKSDNEHSSLPPIPSTVPSTPQVSPDALLTVYEDALPLGVPDSPGAERTLSTGGSADGGQPNIEPKLEGQTEDGIETTDLENYGDRLITLKDIDATIYEHVERSIQMQKNALVNHCYGETFMSTVTGVASPSDKFSLKRTFHHKGSRAPVQFSLFMEICPMEEGTRLGLTGNQARTKAGSHYPCVILILTCHISRPI